MAWTTPHTFVALEVPTAAEWNAFLSENLQFLYDRFGEWQNWTPGLEQNAAAVAATTATAKWVRIGDLVKAQCRLDVTGAGTPGTDIFVTGLPVATAESSIIIGTMGVYDASASTFYHGFAVAFGSDVFAVANGSPFGTGIGNNPSFALANGDVVLLDIAYRPVA